jgi:CheY-like chemotaxis protein
MSFREHQGSPIFKAFAAKSEPIATIAMPEHRVQGREEIWMAAKVPTILVVDDDRVDTLAIRRALRELNVGNPLVAARDGIEAFEHLRGEAGWEKLAQPVLVLLDLNMPRMGGIEFLVELRQDPLLQTTLVFVMTTSSNDEDRSRAYAKNVAGYILKARQGHDFEDAIIMLEHFSRVVEFPGEGADEMYTLN